MTRALLALLLAALVAAGCGSDGGKGTRSKDDGPTGPPAGALDLTIEETADALQDPKRAHVGVWAMLHHLGVGVRDAKSGTVLNARRSRGRVRARHADRGNG